MENLTTKIETISPVKASNMLAKSIGNRRTKEQKVSSYARDMLAGRWQLNGEPIILGPTGELIDGHHRLMACVKSKVSFSSLVVSGVDLETQKTIDMGASRTGADALVFHGYKNANQLQAVVNFMMSVKNGVPRSSNPSTQEIFEFIENYPECQSGATIAARKFIPRLTGACGGIYAIASHLGHKDIADKFMHVLQTGIPSYEHDAAHLLREKMIKEAITGNKMPLRSAHILAVSAWNHFRVSNPVKNLKVGKTFHIPGWTEK